MIGPVALGLRLGSTSWLRHPVEQNHFTHGQDAKEKEETLGVPWSPLRAHLQWPKGLPLGPTS